MNLKIHGQQPGDPKQQADDAANQTRLEAARKFEGILMQQLLSVMRKSAKSGGMGGSEGASGQYTSMFDEVIAERMAEGGGIGLAGTLMESMGGDPELARQALSGQPGSSSLSASQGGLPPSLAQPQLSPPVPGVRGATAQLAHAAYAISAPDAGKQWSRAGTLTERDLASNLEMTTKNGDVARFAVRDAAGYRDAYKCNLFAFEAARRAGFEVPVIERERGYGFPNSNAVTTDAQDGTLRGDWAEVVQSDRIADVKQKLERGEVAVMLTGSGSEGRHGHMAVVERIHDVQLDANGDVQRIEFDGYEARADGAQHLTKRSWNRAGHGEDSKLARNGFGSIQLLALRPAEDAQRPEIRSSGGVRSTRSNPP